MSFTNKFLKIVVLAIIIIVSTSVKTGPPCDSDAFMNSCAPSLEDYVFIKTFPIESSKQGAKTEYSYVLSRGSSYRIVICDKGETGSKMIINLLDRDKKKITSNYLKSSKKFFSLLNYTCAATGVYYIEAFFEDEKKGCGLNILGFKK